MTKPQKKPLVPALRFPKFRDTGEWESTKLSKRGEFTGGGTPSKSNDSYWQGNIPWVSSSDIYDDSIHEFSVSRYITEDALKDSATKLIPENSILLVSRVGVGKLAISKNSVCTSQDFTNFTPIKDDLIFLGYYIKSRTKALLAYSQGMAIKGFTKDDISKLNVFIPSLKEQQKIADCLSSIDELITAETQKLAALKDHKKGLMQQLFPAEGETVPKLRFPEFRDAGEWVLREFSKYIVLFRGSSPRPIENYLTSNSNGVNWIKIGDTKYAENFIISQVKERITPEGAKKSRKVNVGELILANSMSYGKTYQISITGYIYDGWFVLRDYEKHFNKQFLLQLLNSEYMQNQYEKLSAGGIVQNISSDIVYQTVLPNTSLKEQEKIADCLSSVDELITAQSEKVEALKEHKKGLMQQLFPSMDEGDK